MTHDKIASTIFVLTFVSWAPACNQQPTDLDMGDAGDEANVVPDVGGVVGDPWNCGEAEISCVGPLGIGECIDGECQGRLTGCWDTGTNCEALCDQVDASCDASCENAAAFGWMAATPELALSLCAMASRDAAQPLSVSCAEPLPFSDHAAIRCCCR